ncbi:hypothetical protein [uncultured Pedobacter sp.]|uniref:hypothetical protein n=1 Tax=uncultured Pedobacter sp. TaxID=246139 RepID=UPI0025EF4E7E|nr:hypothetical protein [uncultured Pedobacter sp.]
MKNHHTQRIQKIIKGNPKWLTRWGMTLLFCFFCIFFILTTLIPYQEVAKLNAQITVINKVQPVSLNAFPEFLISCKIQPAGETLKIRPGQAVTIRLSIPKRKALKITGKIIQLYKSDHETITLMISAINPGILETDVLSSTPLNAVYLDVITGDTVLFKQLLESAVSNFQPAKL